jgi:hypothetical protein
MLITLHFDVLDSTATTACVVHDAFNAAEVCYAVGARWSGDELHVVARAGVRGLFEWQCEAGTREYELHVESLVGWLERLLKEGG